MTEKVIRLVLTTEIPVEVGNAGLFRAFKIQDEILSCELVYEPVQEEMIGALPAPR